MGRFPTPPLKAPGFIGGGAIREWSELVKRYGAAIRRRYLALQQASEAGMATAEYAIATLAAAGFAGLLYVILKSDQVRGFLVSIINQALSIG